MSSHVAVVTRDLMDASRFRSDAAGFVVVRDLTDERLATAAAIILDLAAGQSPDEAVMIGPPVIAYGAHVDVDALDAARAAGCVEALPRSQIFRRLDEVIEPYR